MGTLAVGLFAQAELNLNKKAGLFLGGGFNLLAVQILGLVATKIKPKCSPNWLDKK